LIPTSCQRFQSTRPRGARHERRIKRLSRTRFNPRARAGRDKWAGSDNECTVVSIHAPARGATFKVVVAGRRFGVSIHAPARGATCAWYLANKNYPVSIHAPARGATEWGVDLPEDWLFQSTRPRGARPDSVLTGDKKSVFQSTRPRGARLYAVDSADGDKRFNPRARAGRDLNV